MWKPAVSCLACSYPNDSDHNFCQKCGFKRKDPEVSENPVIVDTEPDRVKNRLASLANYRSGKPYEKQKSALQKQLESYLWSLPEKKTLKSAIPNDVVSFLVWRDRFGKTVVHHDGCSSEGLRKSACTCPRVLSAGTVDNNIGKLRVIFRDVGRGSQWNDDLGLGNPAAHHSVSRYTLSVQEEQAVARVFPVKAVPMFLDKLRILCLHLRNLIIAPLIKPSQRYIFARELAFFSIDFFSGDRGSDLGRVKTVDILSSPGKDSFILNQVFGKTLRGNNSNVFGLKRIPGSPYCPVTNLEYYVAIANKMSIKLHPGYLFRVTDKYGNITAAPFIGSTIANRLKKHLQDLGIYEGETMHSFRGGCSITLSLLGTTHQDVAKHVGWKSLDMVTHYCEFDKVMSATDPSSVLARSASNISSPITSAEQLGQNFRERNFLKGYKSTFV